MAVEVEMRLELRGGGERKKERREESERNVFGALDRSSSDTISD
jgi:hypothetical protein